MSTGAYGLKKSRLNQRLPDMARGVRETANQSIPGRPLPKPPSERDRWPWLDEGEPLPPTLSDGRAWPRITIVTPSYNQGQFLEATIRSVLLQHYPDLEYVVIDGGSTDASIEIIRKYEHWITGWVSEPDEGQTYAIAKGMASATGVIVNWLNSDDVLWPNALRHVAEAWARSPQSNCVLCGDSYLLDADGDVLEVDRVRPWTEKLLPSSAPYVGGEQASWFFSKETWDLVGGIDLELDYTMDSELTHQAVAAGAWFEPVGDVVAAYREHLDTKTRRNWRTSMAYKERFRFRWLEEVADHERPVYRKRVRRDLFGFYLQHVHPDDRLLVRTEKIARGIRHYPRALVRPYHLRRMAHLLFRGTFKDVVRPG